MNREEFTTLWRMLTGVWPRMDTDETVAAWWGLIGHYPAHHATAAVRRWATDRRTAPAPADIIDGIKKIAVEARQVEGQRQIGAPQCDDCEGTGFVWVTLEGHGTVRRCPRRCQPPAAGERPAPERPATGANNARFARLLHERRAEQAAERARLGEAAYLRARGLDPEAYRIRDGMIVARLTDGRN